MPLYEYVCDHCGVFSAMNSMSAAQESKSCPDCGTESSRILSAPKLAVMTKTQRNAHERNEKAANEPMTRRSSCGCSGNHTCGSNSKSGQSSDGQERSWFPNADQKNCKTLDVGTLIS